MTMDPQQEKAPRLTPEDVHHVVFDRAGFVERGYKTMQVDAFLDRVAATIAELSGQIEAAVARSGKGDLTRALASGETWTVE